MVADESQGVRKNFLRTIGSVIDKQKIKNEIKKWLFVQLTVNFPSNIEEEEKFERQKKKMPNEERKKVAKTSVVCRSWCICVEEGRGDRRITKV